MSVSLMTRKNSTLNETEPICYVSDCRKPTVTSLFLLGTALSFFPLSLQANDGAFYMSGNQLIPIEETQIKVAKEVLAIKKTKSGHLRVTVDYIFDNPADSKELLVGFEAMSPSGDVEGAPKNGQHPYMDDFQVLMNGVPLQHQVAIVDSENYYAGQKIKGISEETATSGDFDTNAPEFDYVYYFDAVFEEGLNLIRHKYEFKLSGSVDAIFSFEYVLTAANRWAGQQIEDFTLIIDLGEDMDFNIARTFFSGFEGWIGAEELLDGNSLLYSNDGSIPMRVLTKDAPVIFKKRNFKPSGELRIWAPRLLPPVADRMGFIDSESNFRTGPTTKSKIKFQPRKGTEGTAVERQGDWIRITLDNGDSGWAHKRNLEMTR